jgi:hypothetical protein
MKTIGVADRVHINEVLYVQDPHRNSHIRFGSLRRTRPVFTLYRNAAICGDPPALLTL